jgi:hypothetical protein
VSNRRLVDRGNPDCDQWEAFDATSEVQPVLGRRGHVDRFLAPSLGDSGFEGLTLRLYEPVSRTWRIWWSDSSRPGRLDPPMCGRFGDGEGHFDGADEIGGRSVRLRFRWVQSEQAPRWEQAFSWDDGARWITNWVMELERPR